MKYEQLLLKICYFLEKIGFVEGVGPSGHGEPNHNLTGDPYFTDGLCAVLKFGHRPNSVEDIHFFDWATPPHRAIYSDD